jgi:hypothetical protein
MGLVRVCINKKETEMTAPLMPKATAVWLIENTALSFEQISSFCHIHILEIQALADNEGSIRIVGFDPIASSQLDLEEIHRCEKDPAARLSIRPAISADSVLGKKKTRYTPVSKRQDRPDAIAWMIKFYPDVPEVALTRLLGTTKPMVRAVKTKTHWNAAQIKPRHPVQLGFCTQAELDAVVGAYGLKQE